MKYEYISNHGTYGGGYSTSYYIIDELEEEEVSVLPSNLITNLINRLSTNGQNVQPAGRGQKAKSFPRPRSKW